MVTDRKVPDDFPIEPDLGAVPGARAKLLVREVDGRYHNKLTEEESWSRYSVCEDLALQLFEYVLRKTSTAGMSRDVALRRVEKGIRKKIDYGEWEFSQREVTWIINRTRQLVIGAADGEAGPP